MRTSDSGMVVRDLPTKVFQLNEVRKTLDYLSTRKNHCRRAWAKNARLNYMIFRLSTCCGLRGCELRRLRLNDFVLGGPRPIIRVRKEIVKGQTRMRAVPLWWDAGTRDDIAEFIEWRRSYLPANAVAVYPEWDKRNAHEYIHRDRCMERWRRFIGYALGNDRSSQLGVHAGRHSFCSHAINTGRSIVEVRDAAGHGSVGITNIYLHAIETGRELPDVFPGEDEDSL